MNILITGGAGFVGANLAFLFREKFPQARILCMDNLHRRGSESNLAQLKARNIDFYHGDIRNTADFADISGNFDLFIEASAEPSVHAGVSGSPRYVLDTNLTGTIHALEFARKRVDKLFFLSTSRVYSITPLQNLALEEGATRFQIAKKQNLTGTSERGISENFSTTSARSFYGASKLASELLIQEYVEFYQQKAIINRCGVIAGPGQFGKVDQGVFTLWLAHHYFNKPLAYKGFGGKGKQVRDLLHPHDLFHLILLQLERFDKNNGEIFNIGGGNAISTSLLEWTNIAQKITGKKVLVSSEPETLTVDIPYYISDYKKAESAFGWKPEISAESIAKEIHRWIHEKESLLKPFFGAT